MSCLDASRSYASPYTGLAVKDESEYETNPERRKDRFRRVLADVLLAVVLKTADAMARVMPYSFRTARLFIGGLSPAAEPALPPLPGGAARHLFGFLYAR